MQKERGPLMTNRLPAVLLIASDTIGPRMAGSGIRYWNLARVIGAQQPVTLATPTAVDLPSPEGVTVVPYGDRSTTEDDKGRRLAQLVAKHDVVVAQHIPYLYADAAVLASRALVVDLYAPWILEKLEYSRIDPVRGEPNRKDDVTILNRLLQLGDFFVCASERQRDFWLGALAAAGRLELAHAAASPSLRSLIDVVGFGLPQARPRKTGPGPRSTVDGVASDDRILLWNGGMWNWLDPLTAIRTAALVARDEPGVRLIFMGTHSPGAQVAEMDVVEQARELARELGLLDRHVFFNDWVPYEERQNWLLEADATLSLHVETVEARYAFRTRMLDNVWCGVPSVVTEGDVLADLVTAHDVGETATAGDTAAVAAAIRRVLEPDRARAVRANLARLSAEFTWERVTAPLLAYCRGPWRLGVTRGTDPSAGYLHELERLYSETAQYARRLELSIDEKDQALSAATMTRPTTVDRRPRPDLSELWRRVRRG
jgi:glycosyltransferase involved in cell wall biosynthesis